MNNVAFAYSGKTCSVEAALELARDLRAQVGDSPPQALLVFASSRYDHDKLTKTMAAELDPEHFVGCSSAGEFIRGQSGRGEACAVAIRTDEMLFSSAIAGGLAHDPRAVAGELTQNLIGMDSALMRFPFRTCLIFCDALAGNTEVLIDDVTRLTSGQYQLVGGGAGDDARFAHTHVSFHGKVQTDSAVLLEILSERPLGIGVAHGWEPTGRPMRVTESEGRRLISINAEPALEVLLRHAESVGQSVAMDNPVPFFLHNVLGIKSPLGWKLRVPLAIEENGSLLCASDIPVGAILSFMRTAHESTSIAARRAVSSAVGQLDGHQPGAALFFDCVATRLRMGADFELELETVRAALEGAPFGGYNTYGQVARCEGQFSGFHNCTAVVCVFPR